MFFFFGISVTGDPGSFFGQLERREGVQSSSPVKGSRSVHKAGTGQRLMGKMGSGCSWGCITFSHLYSPKVQSSSFMGWNSGSVCASSFSLTGETRRCNLDKPVCEAEEETRKRGTNVVYFIELCIKLLFSCTCLKLFYCCHQEKTHQGISLLYSSGWSR